MFGKDRRRILIIFAFAVVIILMLGLEAARAIGIWTVHRPNLPGQLLVSTDEQLVVLSGSGDVERVFEVPGLNTGEARWSPDDEHIAFVAGYGLNLLDVSTGVMHEMSLQAESLAHRVRTFSWSPRGDKIVFVDTNDSQTSLHLLTISDSMVSEIWKCEHSCGTPEWSLDGTEIIFPEVEEQQDMGLHTRIVSMDLGTGKITLLFKVPGAIEMMRWSPDRTRFALVDFSEGLFIADSAGNLRGLADSVGSAVWSPDGNQLAYTAIRHRPNAPAFVYVYDFESGKHFQIYPSRSPLSSLFPLENESRSFVFDWRE